MKPPALPPARRRALFAGLAILALIAGIVVGAGAAREQREEPSEPSRATAPTQPREEGDVYAHTRAGMIAPVNQDVPYRVYVPNGEANTVDVVDPETAEVVRSFPVGGLPQHVTPSHDMRTLFVNSNTGNTLQRVDPRTGEPDGEPIPVEDPYNLYFTPDGASAIVVAERLQRLDFRDPQTMKLDESVNLDCPGVNHLDYSAGASYLVASCEFGSALIKFDLAQRKVVDRIELDDGGAKPVDVKLSPDGGTFYVADEVADGVWSVDAGSFRVTELIETGDGAHGLYPSRDGRLLYASNRDEGSVSVLDFDTGKVRDKWRIPGGGSPDMGGVSPDGDTLWLSGRYNSELYAFDTRSGRLRERIPVGAGPHGAAVWPQPGRYSLGHTGNTR
jgi:YVTN family beta-propeller protein